MADNEKTVKTLEGFVEKYKHEIPPCDEESGDYSIIRLKNEDARKLKDLLTNILEQLTNQE